MTETVPLSPMPDAPQDAAAFVACCSRSILGREPAPEEVRHYTCLLTQAGGHTQVLKSYLECPEFQGRLGGEFVPAGHFYSVVPSAETRKAYATAPATPYEPSALPGIDLNLPGQEAHLRAIFKVHGELMHADQAVEGLRYRFDNPAYSYGDAISYQAMLDRLKPRQIVEVGSGYSSAFALDYIERRLDWQTRITFIEPYPQLLHSLLRPGDTERITIIPTGVQGIPDEVFTALGQDDILFIDSTHCSKLGSDVNHLFFQVLPKLKPGVVVHIHDIFWPFDYPASWIEKGFSWNESYLLHALLIDSDRFRIEFFADFYFNLHRRRVSEHAPSVLKNTGGHIWLRRR